MRWGGLPCFGHSVSPPPSYCPCLLIRAGAAVAVLRPARRRAPPCVEPNGITVPAPADHDRLRGRDLPGRHASARTAAARSACRATSTPTARPSARRPTRRPIRACSCRCAISRPRWCSASRRPRAASPGTTSRPPAPDDGAHRDLSDRPVPDAGRPGHHQHRRAHQPRLRGRPDRLRAAQEPRPAACCRASTTPSTQRNVRCTGTGCTMPGYWKMALTYLSKAHPNSYYLAFEDWEGADQNTWQGNDGDFNDKVFKIDGVICDGGGEPCDTGMPGVCSQGVTECQVGAGIICKPAVMQERREVRQPRQRLQRHGRRRRRPLPRPTSSAARACASASATTASSRARSASSATPTGCARIRAAPSSTARPGRCARRGTCVGGCQGVTCPLGQVCQLGVCVDPCAGVSCPGAVCEMGACVSACRCRACDTGQVCAMGGALDGHCVDTGCDTMTCPTGHDLPQGLVRRRVPGRGLSGRRARASNGMCDPPPPTTPTGPGGTRQRRRRWLHHHRPRRHDRHRRIGGGAQRDRQRRRAAAPRRQRRTAARGRQRRRLGGGRIGRGGTRARCGCAVGDAPRAPAACCSLHRAPLARDAARDAGALALADPSVRLRAFCGA